MGKNPWASFLQRWLLSVLIAIGMLTAQSVSAQTTVVQSEIPDAAFTNWLTMHPNSFGSKNSSPVRQCLDSVGTVENLQKYHCEKQPGMLERGECRIVWVPDGTKYRWMRGHVNGQASKLTFNLRKRLGRYDRALRCDLGDGIIVDWFTGVKGQSCNNLGAPYFPPPKPAAVTPPPVMYAPPQVMQHTGVVRSDLVQYNQGVTLESCCPGCVINIPSSFTVIGDGDGLQSSGSTAVDR